MASYLATSMSETLQAYNANNTYMPAGQAITRLNCGLDSESYSSVQGNWTDGQMKQFAWPCIACPTALAAA